MASVPHARGDASASVMRGLLARWRAWRDARLASPAFQRWAASVPGVRRVADRHAAALFDLTAGFVYSQVLYACVRLDVFEQLAAGPRCAEELAAQWQMTPSAAARLLEAAVALRLLERRGAGFGLGVLGAALRGNPGVSAMIEHHPMLYADLQDPLALLRGGAADTQLSAFWAYARAEGAPPPDAVRDYTRLMARSQPLVAGDILDALPLSDVHRWLDIGGGDGSFALALAERAPALQVVVADLPAVAETARARIAAAALAGRVTARPCNALSEVLPTGFDAASLVRVIHDHDDAPALALLRAAWAALRPGGLLVIAEPMAATPGAERMGAYFSVYLWAMGSGRPRSADELTALARQAGFAAVRERPTRRPLLTRVLTGRKPETAGHLVKNP